MAHKKRKFASWVLKVTVLVILTDLYLFGAQFVRPYEFATSSRKEDILVLLNRSPDQGRIVTKSNLFLPNDGLLYKFHSVMGYDPLILRRYVNYVQSSQGEKQNDHVVNLANLNDPSAKLIELLNVKQVVMSERVMETDNPVNYLTIVTEAAIKRDYEVLDFMQSENFDPKKMVVLEQKFGLEPTSQGEGSGFLASGSVLNYDNESIRIQASTNQPAYLVVSEIFYPGWQATVDGKKVGILRGNYLFRVMPLEKGDHEVHLYFVSWPFRIGVVVSLITLIISIWFIMRGRERRIHAKL